MSKVTRRDVLKTGLLAPAAVAVAVANGMGPMGLAMQAGGNTPELHPASSGDAHASVNANAGAGRERLLLDFGWRFHFGNADDPEKDFEFGSGRTGNFQKTGNFLAAGAMAFDDSDWRNVDLPHDWAIELPFQNDPALSSKGYYPLGRTYPAIRSLPLRCDRLCQPGRKERAAGARGRDTERWLVLRGRGHLPACVAGEDAPGAREAVGHVCGFRGEARRGDFVDPHGGQQ
jgi:hypothetical protein